MKFNYINSYGERLDYHVATADTRNDGDTFRHVAYGASQGEAEEALLAGLPANHDILSLSAS